MATVASYVYEHKQRLSKDLGDSEMVAFVDVGYSKTTITIAEFERQGDDLIEAKIVLHHSDKNLGGRDCDWLLLEHFSKKF